MNRIQPGDWVILFSPDEKRFLIQIQEGQVLHTHKGSIPHNELSDLEYGTQHRGFILCKPSLEEIILKGIRRQTQIVYPKDAGLLAVKLSLCTGKFILEIGSGSGAFTTFLSHLLFPDGKVISYEIQEAFLRLAQKNVQRFGNSQLVELRLGDPRDYLPEKDFDAIVVDVKTPWDFLPLCWEKLKGGHPIAFTLPTTNQVQQLLQTLEASQFTSIEVTELLERKYKPVAARLRPEDRMIAHTIFLITARKFIPP